jgi:hypothetical protein
MAALMRGNAAKHGIPEMLLERDRDRDRERKGERR